MEQVRYSVQLNQVDDVVLSCESLESQLKFLVLVDASSAVKPLVATAEQTAAVGVQ